jgi:triphosphatase
MKRPHTAAVVQFRPRASAAAQPRAGAVKAASALLDRAMTVSVAFKAVMRANLAHLVSNDRGMVEGYDVEYLHQMRVALRRLRSAISVFAPVLPRDSVFQLRAELKWLASRLGPARDWDVLLTQTLPPIQAEFGPHPGLERFAARCRTLRGGAAAGARRAVRSGRYQRLVSRLEAWLAQEEWMIHADPQARPALLAPVAEFASSVLERGYDRVRDKGRSLDRLDASELHRLRIAIKKFRYASDFFAGIYDEKAARAALKRLSRLQDILGAMNDAATVANLLSQGFSGARGRHALEAKGLLLGWSRGRAATLKRELKSAWNEFRAAGKFW